MAKSYILGYDIGTSFVKASLMEVSGQRAGTVSVPEKEMEILVNGPGWAEQHPEDWWDNLVKATLELKSQTNFSSNQIQAIGITYQMHGLVLIDSDHQVLRPSIIWCDSRAVDIGNEAFHKLGEQYCLQNFLNSPGNFTASKLRWVQQNEPQCYERIYKAMLPGDFIAMKMTGEVNTTISGLSEGIFWNFKNEELAGDLLDHFAVSRELIPDLVPVFGVQGKLSAGSAYKLGLDAGIPLTYRAGDQPNNAFSLNVLEPGEIAATAGTSGVVYGVSDRPAWDDQSRVNTFVHVNHSEKAPRYGTLLCVNGTGILNSWLRRLLSHNTELSYDHMNHKASMVPPGADGLKVFPFGNGAERVLNNYSTRAWIEGIDFNIHNESHIFRSAQEGIAHALNYGFRIMKATGIDTSIVRAGNANMFLSPIFRQAFVNTTGCTLELYDTDGSLGAARAAAVGAGIYGSAAESFKDFKPVKHVEPEEKLHERYQEIYNHWLEVLNKKLA